MHETRHKPRLLEECATCLPIQTCILFPSTLICSNASSINAYSHQFPVLIVFISFMFLPVDLRDAFGQGELMDPRDERPESRWYCNLQSAHHHLHSTARQQSDGQQYSILEILYAKFYIRDWLSALFLRMDTRSYLTRPSAPCVFWCLY